MAPKSSAFLVLFGLGIFVLAGWGCGNASTEKKEARTYSRDSLLPTDSSIWQSNVGVAVADMDGDGDLDMVSSNPLTANPHTRSGVKYFENVGNGNFVDRGVIAASGASISVADMDGDGVLDIVIVVTAPFGTNRIQIIKNPISQRGRINDRFSRKAPKGKFRVVGVDLFDDSNRVEGDFDTLDRARKHANKKHATTKDNQLLEMYVYDDTGLQRHYAGVFWPLPQTNRSNAAHPNPSRN